MGPKTKEKIEAEIRKISKLTDNKFCVDNPVHIPRIGEFIDSDDASGHVTLVQYYYKTRNQKIDESKEFSLVVMVYLGERQ